MPENPQLFPAASQVELDDGRNRSTANPTVNGRDRGRYAVWERQTSDTDARRITDEPEDFRGWREDRARSNKAGTTNAVLRNTEARPFTLERIVTRAEK